jgi:hypothetical protein
MAQALDIKHIDRRTVARYVERGAISQADLDKYLSQLPDIADKAEPITTESPDAPKSESEED